MPPSNNANRPTHISRPSLTQNASASHQFSPSAMTASSSQGGYSYSQYAGYGNNLTSGSGPATSPGIPPSGGMTRTGSSGGLSNQQHSRQASGTRGPGILLPPGSSTNRNVSSGQAPQPGAQEKSDQAREVARVHFKALRTFLWTWLENESPTSRASAREKLTRLTRSQFQELSTDVYDELVRRRDAEEGGNGEAPFLPVREDFHPKRNQARQKLATLPKNRFKDLGSDVYFELKRRWPEFADEFQTAQSPAVESPTSAYPQTAYNIHDNLAGRSNDQTPGFIGQSQPPMPNRDQSSSPSPNKNPTNGRSRTPLSPVNKNPAPTSDRLVPGPARRPSQMDRAPGLPSSQSQSGLQSLSGSTTNDTVVPNKSTMTEERIEVPYASESRDSLASGDESGLDTEEEEREKEQEREKERERQRPSHQRQSSRASSSMGRAQTISRTSSRMGTLANGRSRTPEGREELDDETNSPSRRKNASMVSNDDRASSYSNSSQAQRTRSEAYRDQPGFSQQNRSASGTSLSTATVTGGGMAATAMADLLKERKARTDAETKASGLERRLSALEKEVRDATEREKWERDRAKELEAEVRGHKERSANHANELWSMQRELDNARSQAESSKRDYQTAKSGDDAQLQQWKERYARLEADMAQSREELSRSNKHLNENDSAEAIKELQNELIILMEELKAVSARNEELMAERDEDGELIQQLEADVADYKRKWETTRTQLRNLKATSTMFVSKPITEDHMPASLDGNIADIHVTAFQSAIDNLLAIARSSQPTGVLQAMKGVVEAINDVSEDVHNWEAEPNFTIDQTKLDDCKHRSSTTLNSLMQAARNHAMSAGLSPISLLDAAASHVSANVVEIIKLLKIRKTIKTSTSTNSIGRKSFTEMQARRSFSSGSAVTGKVDSDPRPTAPPSPGESMLSPHQQNFVPGPPSPSRTGRADSVFSTSSTGQQSDAFDLDRKASILGARQPPTFNADLMPSQRTQTGRLSPHPASSGSANRSFASPEPSQHSRTDDYRETHDSTPLRSPGYSSPGRASPVIEEQQPEPQEQRPRRNSGEWEEVKPYLSTQSSALVNSIQQLLAEIRNGNNANGSSSTSALNDHLSEVIAIGSSIVAVASGVLPNEDDGPEGVEAQRLLSELMHSTDKLSTHQSATEFTKAARQEIASAAFGMAKALRGLMKVQ